MTRPARTPAGVIVATVLIGCWAAGVTFTLQVLGWGADQLLLVLGLPGSGWLWPPVSVVNAALVAIPAALLAGLPRSPVIRRTGLVWLGGAAAVAVLGGLRAVPGAEPELYLGLFAVVATVAGLLWRRLPPIRTTSAPAATPGYGSTGLAVSVGLLVLLPWLWLGALGGAVETGLAVAAAAATGYLATCLLDRGFWGGFDGSRVGGLITSALAAGVVLLLLAAGTGGAGSHLPLLAMLPALGLAAAVLTPGDRRLARFTLIAVPVLGPLGFTDPQEVTLLLTNRDVPFWTTVAAVASTGLALLAGIGALLVARFAPRSGAVSGAGPGAVSGAGWFAARLRRAVAAVAGVSLAAAGLVHIGLGTPGLHGDRLFVVLAEQADLSGLPPQVAGATGPDGRDARAQAVYQLLTSHAEQTQAELRAELDRLRLPYTPYYLVNAIEVSGGPAVRAWLAGRDDVDRVLRSQRLRPLPAEPPAQSGEAGLHPDDPQWNLSLIGADRVWQELDVTGEGIVVGSLDSGVDGSHPALRDGFRGGDDSWLDPWNHTTTPTDRNGHGTHTLGTAVGGERIGVAPGSQWTGCVNLDRNLANPAYYLDCLQFMLAPYPAGSDPFRDGAPERAPHVLTNSWACPPIEGCDQPLLRPATAALTAAGLYLVVAAGNTGPFCGSIEEPPAPYPEVLTVGAVNREGRLASFSSRGPVDGVDKPDLVAPGVAVVSAMPGGGYAPLSGTSMATPHLAGVVALMWSADRSLIGDVETTTDILHRTARPVPAPDPVECGGPASLTGAGLVDAPAAVRAALARAGG